MTVQASRQWQKPPWPAHGKSLIPGEFRPLFTIQIPIFAEHSSRRDLATANTTQATFYGAGPDVYRLLSSRCDFTNVILCVSKNRRPVDFFELIRTCSQALAHQGVRSPNSGGGVSPKLVGLKRGNSRNAKQSSPLMTPARQAR